MSEEKEGIWRTVSGRRIFIKEGESLSEAMSRSGKFKTPKKVKVDENGYLTKKSYSNVSEEFYNSLTKEEKKILQYYVFGSSYGGSSEANKISAENDRKTYILNTDPDNFVSRREVDLEHNEIVREYEKQKAQILEKYDNDWRKANPEIDAIYRKLNEETTAFSYTLQGSGIRPIWNDEDKAYAKELQSKWNANEEMYKKFTEGKDYSQFSQLPEYKKYYEERSRIKELENKRFGYGHNWDEVIHYDERTMVNNNYRELAGIEYLNMNDIYNRDVSKYKDINNDGAIRQMEAYQRDIKQMDNIFTSKGVTLDQDIVVFRRSYETPDEIKKGYTKYGYTSTTGYANLPKKMPSGNRFGDSQVEITIPKGTPMLFLENIGKITMSDASLGRQHEILLPRGYSFKYKSYNSEMDRYQVEVVRKDE